MHYLTNQKSCSDLISFTPGILAHERKAVGKRSEDIPEHVLNLTGVVDEVSQRMLVGEGEREHSE